MSTPEQRKLWEAAYGPKNEAFRKANLQGKALVKGLLRKDPQELRPLNPELRPLT